MLIADTSHDAGTSTGRVCDGYGPIPPVLAPNPESTHVGSYHPSPELRSLQFFVEKTVVQFESFFPDDLWSTRVLQMAYSHPCIRHALVSLSAHHERYMNPPVGGETSFALLQHNLAIRQLLDTKDQSIMRHVHLISCPIFICIEVFSPCSTLKFVLLTSFRFSGAGMNRPSAFL